MNTAMKRNVHTEKKNNKRQVHNISLYQLAPLTAVSEMKGALEPEAITGLTRPKATFAYTPKWRTIASGFFYLQSTVKLIRAKRLTPLSLLTRKK